MAYTRYTKESNQVHPAQRTVYRVPMNRVENFEMKTFGGIVYLFGELVDKLGKYEDLGSPDEIAKKLGIRCTWTK